MGVVPTAYMRGSRETFFPGEMNFPRFTATLGEGGGTADLSLVFISCKECTVWSCSKAVRGVSCSCLLLALLLMSKLLALPLLWVPGFRV